MEPKRRGAGRRRRMSGLGACLLFVALLAVTTAGQQEAVRKGPSPLTNAHDPAPAVVAYDNGDVSPWAECFVFDSPMHPKLLALREKHRLDDVVADAKTDLERAVALKKWVNSKMVFGHPEPDMFSDWSAVAILEKYERGERGWCGQFAMVFQQACMAMGLPARFIEVGVPDNPACHFTTEVYLREYDKWAVIDSTGLSAYNLYYTLDGAPQSALEMHFHVLNKTLDRVKEVHTWGTQQAGRHGSPSRAFYYVRWLTRCDVVTRTPEFVDLENVFDRLHDTVEWRHEPGENVEWVAWEHSPHTSWALRNARLSAWNTSDPEVVNWHPTDRVRIALRPYGNRAVFLHLWQADINFDHFRVRVDDGQWADLPKTNAREGPRDMWSKDRCLIRLPRGTHTIEAQLVRRDGSTGPTSFVKLSD